MKRNKLNVILTCCGYVTTPGMVASLKKVTEREVDVIGVDMSPNGPGPHIVDKFYQVPRGDSVDYVDALLEICRREQVHVILPRADNECLALAKHRGKFEEIGTVVAISDYDVLENAFDKEKFCQILRDKGVPYPRFIRVNSLQELVDAVFEMGYPLKNVVIKPVRSIGGRGARILSGQNLTTQLLDEKPGSLLTSLEFVRKVFEGNEDKFKPMVVMEYLPGTSYSVEVLSKEGVPLYVIPKIRIEGSPSCTTVGRVDLNTDVQEVASRICNAFSFNYCQNYEMKYSEAGVPIPYDLNPRVAASIAFCTAAGVNLIYFTVKMAVGEDIPILPIKNGVKMFRYYNELFI